MEAITYSRAQSYGEELPVDFYRVWQPRDLIRYLTEIDPHGAFVSSALSVGIEEEYGVPAKVMKPLGVETALTMKNLREHYNAFGSFLHIPTLDQIEKKKIDIPGLKRHCEQCVEILEKILSSKIWNINIGQFVTIECRRCDTNFKWRYNEAATEPMHARCVKCSAGYLLRRENDKLAVEPDWQIVKCQDAACDGEFGIWRDQMKPGNAWKCECGKNYILNLTFQEFDPNKYPEAS